MVRPNDRTKPRFRGCSGRTSVLSKQLWEEYNIKNPENTVTWQEFKNCILESNRAIYTHVIDNRDGFEFPKLLGFNFIATCKRPKKKNVDFKTSEQVGKVVYHRNYDTDGKIAKIFYTNFGIKYKLRNRRLWVFTACREYRDALKPVYRQNYNRYIEISAITKIWRLFSNGQNR